jgi:hypothetical protein
MRNTWQKRNPAVQPGGILLLFKCKWTLIRWQCCSSCENFGVDGANKRFENRVHFVRQIPKIIFYIIMTCKPFLGKTQCKTLFHGGGFLEPNSVQNTFQCKRTFNKHFLGCATSIFHGCSDKNEFSRTWEVIRCPVRKGPTLNLFKPSGYYIYHLL